MVDINYSVEVNVNTSFNLVSSFSLFSLAPLYNQYLFIMSECCRRSTLEYALVK